jgi:hypothetical protein
MTLERLFDFISKRQYEFYLGWSVVGQFTALFAFETFAMVFCTKFGIVGYPAMFLYLIAPVLAVIAVVFLGYKMIKTRYAHKYQKYGWDVNEDWVSMKKDIATIKELVENR